MRTFLIEVADDFVLNAIVVDGQILFFRRNCLEVKFFLGLMTSTRIRQYFYFFTSNL
jgi:hypothetical protein